MRNLFSLLLCICSLSFLLPSQNLIAQTDFVKITPMHRYKFKVRNTSEFNLYVDMLGEKHRIRSGQTLYFERRDIDEGSTMQLIYTSEDYLARQEALTSALNRMELDFEVLKEGIELYLDLRKKGKKVSLWEVLGGLGVGYEAKKLMHSIKSLENQLNKNQDVFFAQVKKGGRYSSNFYEVLFYDDATQNSNGKKVRTGLTAIMGIDWSFPTRKQDLGDFWDRKSEDISSNLAISFKLLPELRWGRSEYVLSSLHGFIAQERPSYGLKTGERTFYVGEEYVEGSSPDLLSLLSPKHVNLHLHQTSIGGFVRTYFHPSLYLDLGAGYVINNRVNLHFNKKEGEFFIQHLSKPYELDEFKFKDVGVLEGKKIYGLARIGTYFNRAGDESKPEGLAVFLALKVAHTPIIKSNDDYHLYYTDNLSSSNTARKVSIMEGGNVASDLELQFRFGVGLHF